MSYDVIQFNVLGHDEIERELMISLMLQVLTDCITDNRCEKTFADKN
jgi:hypothetical protein